MTSSDPAGDVGAVGGRRDRDHTGQRRPEARRPAEREHRAEQWRAADGRQLPRREPGLRAAARGMKPTNTRPITMVTHAADALQQKLIGDQRGRHAEHRDGAEHEHRGEPGDEQRAPAPATRSRAVLTASRARARPRRRRPRPDTTDSRAPAAPRTARRTTPARRARTRRAPAEAVRRRRFRRNRSCRRCRFSAARRCTTGSRSSASSSRRNTAATRCSRSSTTVDGMTVVGYLPPNAIIVRIAGS